MSETTFPLTRIQFPLPEGACEECLGGGQLSTDDQQTPWLEWAALPSPSNMSVVMGLVRPVTCPECNGTGRKP